MNAPLRISVSNQPPLTFPPLTLQQARVVLIALELALESPNRAVDFPAINRECMSRFRFVAYDAGSYLRETCEPRMFWGMPGRPISDDVTLHPAIWSKENISTFFVLLNRLEAENGLSTTPAPEFADSAPAPAAAPVLFVTLPDGTNARAVLRDGRLVVDAPPATGGGTRVVSTAPTNEVS